MAALPVADSLRLLAPTLGWVVVAVALAAGFFRWEPRRRPMPAPSWQLAADSRDRRRRVPAVAVDSRGTVRRTRRPTARRALIRPLGRSGAEHLDVTGSPDDGAAAGWRLGGDPRAEDAERDERRKSPGTATGDASV